jgi:hypothetical protein
MFKDTVDSDPVFRVGEPDHLRLVNWLASTVRVLTNRLSKLEAAFSRRPSVLHPATGCSPEEVDPPSQGCRELDHNSIPVALCLHDLIPIFAAKFEDVTGVPPAPPGINATAGDAIEGWRQTKDVLVSVP